jgi:hypothetical protein
MQPLMQGQSDQATLGTRLPQYPFLLKDFYILITVKRPCPYHNLPCQQSGHEPFREKKQAGAEKVFLKSSRILAVS